MRKGTRGRTRAYQKQYNRASKDGDVGRMTRLLNLIRGSDSNSKQYAMLSRGWASLYAWADKRNTDQQSARPSAAPCLLPWCHSVTTHRGGYCCAEHHEQHQVPKPPAALVNSRGLSWLLARKLPGGELDYDATPEWGLV